MKNCFFILLGLIFLFGCRKDNQDPTTIENNLNLENTGDFIFDSYPTTNSKPVAVFFHIPNGIDKSYAPILFVLPGMNRNAEEYRDSWIALANQFQFMVFSLEFSNQFFPNSNAYQEGFVFNENGVLNDESVWTFSFIEPIFDEIKESLNYQNNTYDLFGHSGGAQFVHRFVFFKPLSRLNRAISANAGWYTIPDQSIEYPYGVFNTTLNNNDLENFFNQKLIIHIGTNDNNPNDPSLRKTPEANAQGLNRLERAFYFFSESDSISNSKNYNYKWEIHQVDNVGHNHNLMASYAATFLYQ